MLEKLLTNPKRFQWQTKVESVRLNHEYDDGDGEASEGDSHCESLADSSAKALQRRSILQIFIGTFRSSMEGNGSDRSVFEFHCFCGVRSLLICRISWIFCCEICVLQNQLLNNLASFKLVVLDVLRCRENNWLIWLCEFVIRWWVLLCLGLQERQLQVTVWDPFMWSKSSC